MHHAQAFRDKLRRRQVCFGTATTSTDASMMDHIGQPRHPEVLPVIESVIAKARKTNVFVGMAIGDDPDAAAGWLDKGVQWMSLGNEFALMLRGTRDVVGKLRQQTSGA